MGMIRIYCNGIVGRGSCSNTAPPEKERLRDAVLVQPWMDPSMSISHYLPPISMC
jgi:hypothetical protein